MKRMFNVVPMFLSLGVPHPSDVFVFVARVG